MEYINRVENDVGKVHRHVTNIEIFHVNLDANVLHHRTDTDI